MKNLLLLILISFVCACTPPPVIGPLPANPTEICHHLDLHPTCKEGNELCYVKYLTWDVEDLEYVKTLHECM